MEKHSKVKSRRKFINPIFHVQTKDEDDNHITKDIIKSVRKTGQLNLSCRHLSSVPEKMFTMYELTDENAVNIDFSRTSKEDDEVWWNIKPLTHLDLSSNVLTNIPVQIGMFQDLTILSLQDNNLTSLPPELGNLTKLTKLFINRNKINNLPKEFFKLTELKNFSISNNCLECVSKSIADLVMLEKLDMSNNLIPKLPSGIGFLVRLTEINVSNNKLTELPPDIVNLRSLLKLDISHNSIRHLPDMGELRKLQLLYAQHNDIEEIPGFQGCEQVEEVYFGNNFIKEIPLEFCENMVHLKILELRDNQIETVPNEITNLAHLTKLDLSNNNITELPYAMGLMPHLQSFKIEGNKLKQIRPDIIQTGTNRILRHLREKISEEDMQTINMISLEVSYDNKIFPDRYQMRNGNILNLALKNLTHVPEECFSEAKEAKVTVVDLCKNRFIEVPSGLIIIADYLTELNLSVNQLKELPEFIKDLTKLKFCDFSKNLLMSLPESFASMVSLRELILSNNKQDKNNPIVPFFLFILCLELKGNPFRQPRYAILDQGTESVLSYLRDKIPL
ncbi:hypothetical protein NQ314_002851 [Rhamnusium bicolor]|uniref:Disease resistance R13L4/SHOC-2-like LRR domain-containing protein n=1 Tax=Rhamnusium bicolor TaxID=1586634 RepID=A0AAV8ZNI4_9CUCU|nr:hypothetical protein NQ314_002851 [Rhamnusium bicolor]